MPAVKTLLVIAFSGIALGAGLDAAAVSPHIIVDQVGWLTGTPKVLVFAAPQLGQNAPSPSTFTPGTTFEVRRASDDGLAFTGNTAVWNAGATHFQSGDRGWWGDFSALTAPGDYYVQLPGGSQPGARSYEFSIGSDIYNGALEASTRTFYYQRCGTAITATHGGAWTHAACHLGQASARLYDGGVGAPGTARDITGGWHDAGDYRKYVSFSAGVLWDLLHSYEWNPCAYGDASGIPESGNGVPDILDEVKWELDWLLKMQRPDGALYSGAFVTGGAGGDGDPSAETATYYYANASTGATGTGAFAFALGARLLGAFPAYAAYAATLQAAAEQAWTYLQANPTNLTYNHTGFANADANVSAAGDAGLRLLAAAELFALTGNAAYRSYVDAHAMSDPVECNHHPLNNTSYGYRNIFDSSCNQFLQRGYISYALAPGATASLVAQIRTAVANAADQSHNGINQDLYRAYMWDGHHTWGSNGLKAQWATHMLWAVKVNANPARNTLWMNSASEYLHYFFGRNPLNWSYTTRSDLYGADKPITQFYHGWFAHGTAWDLNPAPGFLPGGPNQFYATTTTDGGGTPVYPPAGEPILKSYRDWNTVWPDSSWSVTENSLGYQSRYEALLSAFSACATPPGTPTASPTPTLYAGTPTHTPTPTPSPSPSASPTPGPCSSLLNGMDSLAENGTWAGGQALRSIVSPLSQGTGALQVQVTVTAAWLDDFAVLSAFAPAGLGAYARLLVDVSVDASLAAGGTWNHLILRAACNSCSLWYEAISADEPQLVAGTQTLAFDLDFSQGGLSPSDPVDFLRFVINRQNGVTGTIILDNLRLELACATPSATRSPTGTLTATLTRTPSASPSGTMTPTRTSSPSPSLSPSATATPSGSPTETMALSPTLTPSPSITPTFTNAPPGSSETATPTSSPTGTATLSPSPTGTMTLTLSSSPTPGAASATPSPSATLTRTPTPSASPSASSTASASPTQTASPTWTASMTLSATPSATPTASPSAAPATPTATPSATPAATALSGAPVILEAVPIPHPGPRSIRVRLEGPVDQVRLRIYSSALNLVGEELSGPYGAGWQTLPMPAAWLSAAPGNYFARLSAARDGKDSGPGPALRLYLLR